MTSISFPKRRTRHFHRCILASAIAGTSLALLAGGCDGKGTKPAETTTAAATDTSSDAKSTSATATAEGTTKANTQPKTAAPEKTKATADNAAKLTKPERPTAKKDLADAGLKPAPTATNERTPLNTNGELIPQQPNVGPDNKGPRLANANPAQPGTARGPSPIKFEPSPLDLGELTADVAKTGTVTIINVSDQPVKITKAVPGCGCTTVGWPREPISPGASAEMEITLKPGPKQGIRLKKRVTFQLEGHPSQVLSVEGDVAAYVTIKPDIIAARIEEEDLSDDIVLTSADGTEFMITEVVPPVATLGDSKTGLEHTVQVDWNAWEEAGRPVKLAFKVDHPKVSQVTALVKRRSPSPPKPRGDDPTRAQNVPSINDLSGAARAGDVQRVKLLLADNKDPNQADRNGGRTPLHWAIRNNNAEIVDLLIEAGADVNKGDQAGKTALSHAAESGKVEMTEKLIKAGADVNKRDLVGGNSVLWAAGLGTPQTLKIVVDAGGAVDVKDINGLTPLQWAAQTGKTDSMAILIEAGADVNATDGLNGESVLMRAARSGQIKSIDLLLENGAKTDTRTKMGSNALHIASEFGSVEIVERLVDSGLDPKAVDSRDWNALDYAKNRVDERRFAVIAYLTPRVEIKTPGEAPETGSE